MNKLILAPSKDSQVGGVCKGIANALEGTEYEIDVTYIRLIFFILAFCSSVGIIIYWGLYVCMPNAEE